MTRPVSQLLKLALGLIIAVAIILSLSQRLTLDLIEELKNIPYAENAIYLVLAIILMPLNWYIESKKWQILVVRRLDISLKDAVKSVFAGMSIAIMTPNRIGEYGGRILLFNKKYHSFLIWSNIVSNYSQLLVICIFGCFGLTFWLISNFSDLVLSFSWLLVLAIVISSVALMGYFNVLYFLHLFIRLIPIDRLKRFLSNSLRPLGIFKTNILAKLLALSTIRYLIYTCQYFLTLCFYSVKLSTLETVELIPTVYLFKSVIPYPPILGYLVRGEISIDVFQFLNLNLLAVLAASTSIWIINVVVPAVAGYFIILKEDLLKK